MVACLDRYFSGANIVVDGSPEWRAYTPCLGWVKFPDRAKKLSVSRVPDRLHLRQANAPAPQGLQCIVILRCAENGRALKMKSPGFEKD